MRDTRALNASRSRLRAPAIKGATLLCVTMYKSISFRKSTPSKKCQLNASIGNSEQQVDDFGGGVI